MDRSYPNRPFVGVGAVIWRNENILLTRRGKAPRADEWSLPGGAQEIGETVRDACLREVKEETGLTVEIERLLDVVDGIFKDARGQVQHHYTLVDFKAHWISGSAVPGDDVAEVRWVPLSELDAYDLWDETRRIILSSAPSPGS